MRFDLTDLRLFRLVVETGSITRGAERAGLALASASARIRGMEETAAVELLERHPRGVRPTPAGRAVLHHAQLVLGQMEQMRGDLRQYAGGLRGHVRFLSNSAGLFHLSGAVGRFLAENPSIDVDLEERPSTEIAVTVAAGLADLGIGADIAATSRLETQPFRLDRLVLVVPEEHALASRKEIFFRDALDEPFIGLAHGSALQTHVSSHASREGRPFKLRVRLNTVEAICAMVESGVGVAIVPEVALRSGLPRTAIRLVPLADPWASRQLRICARRFSELPAHAKRLVEQLRDVGT
jgi:DNA-binding transcriptional LysR family regulator